MKNANDQNFFNFVGGAQTKGNTVVCSFPLKSNYINSSNILDPLYFLHFGGFLDDLEL